MQPSLTAWPAAAVLGDTLYCLYQSTEDAKLAWCMTTDGANWTMSPEPATSSATYPFACVFTLGLAEYNALDAVT